MHLVLPFPSPIVKEALAGRSPLICSRAVIIGPLRSQKDTQDVAETETVCQEKGLPTPWHHLLRFLCYEICVVTAAVLILYFDLYEVVEWMARTYTE